MIITAAAAKAIADSQENAINDSVEERLAQKVLTGWMFPCIQTGAEQHLHLLELTKKTAAEFPGSSSSSYWTPGKFFSRNFLPKGFSLTKYRQFIRAELKLRGFKLESSKTGSLKIMW